MYIPVHEIPNSIIRYGSYCPALLHVLVLKFTILIYVFSKVGFPSTLSDDGLLEALRPWKACFPAGPNLVVQSQGLKRPPVMDIPLKLAEQKENCFKFIDL